MLTLGKVKVINYLKIQDREKAKYKYLCIEFHFLMVATNDWLCPT